MDKYGLANKYVKTLKKIVRVIVISDLKNIEYDADLIINGFIGYKNKIVQNKYGTKCLLGPKYQILDHRYVNNRFSNEKKFDICNVAGLEETSLEHVVRILSKILKKNPIIDFTTDRESILIGSTNKMKSFNFQYEIDLETGLNEMVSGITNH